MLLLIGVGLERATCLHHAERLAGREPFVRWYCDQGTMRPARTGGCSAAFCDFASVAGTPRRAVVHGSEWTVFELGPLIEAASAAVATDPLLGLCAEPNCPKCVSTRARVAAHERAR